MANINTLASASELFEVREDLEARIIPCSVCEGSGKEPHTPGEPCRTCNVSKIVLNRGWLDRLLEEGLEDGDRIEITISRGTLEIMGTLEMLGSS